MWFPFFKKTESLLINSTTHINLLDGGKSITFSSPHMQGELCLSKLVLLELAMCASVGHDVDCP